MLPPLQQSCSSGIPTVLNANLDYQLTMFREQELQKEDIHRRILAYCAYQDRDALLQFAREHLGEDLAPPADACRALVVASVVKFRFHLVNKLP